MALPARDEMNSPAPSARGSARAPGMAIRTTKQHTRIARLLIIDRLAPGHLIGHISSGAILPILGPGQKD